MQLENKKYNISVTLFNRYKSFILEYIDNGFNGTRAYAKAYKRKPDDTARAEAPTLLAKPCVVRILCDELAKTGIDFSVEYIYERVHSIIADKKTKPGDRLRALELIARMKGYMKPDSTQSVAIFTGLDAKEKAIIANRLPLISTQPTDSKEVVIDSER